MERTYYDIFRTDHATGKTTLVCGGSHDTVDECRAHFLAYSYGFMDGLVELQQLHDADMKEGSHGPWSFQLLNCGHVIEYFMLLNKEAEDLVKELLYKTKEA